MRGKGGQGQLRSDWDDNASNVNVAAAMLLVRGMAYHGHPEYENICRDGVHGSTKRCMLGIGRRGV